MEKVEEKKIFISHSSYDIAYVQAFVENVLELGLEIPSKRIFCSSIPGCDITSGQYIPDRLREEINKSSLALLFVSNNYKTSEICMNEVGAVWVRLAKEKVIPILLPNTKFNELGFLNLSKVGLEIDNKQDIIKLIEDCKEELNPKYNLQLLHSKIDDFLKSINTLKLNKSETEDKTKLQVVNECTECYDNNLCPLDNIIRKAIPTCENGIHKITSVKDRNELLNDLSQAKFFKNFWYKYSEGDDHVEKLIKLPNENWLISSHNTEIKVSEIWVCMDARIQYEFILIRSDKLDPYKIDSDIGGTGYCVGVLNDETIVSENEKFNGYAIINGEKLDLNERGVEIRNRKSEAHWIFMASKYNRVGYGLNSSKVQEFCKKLDNGEIPVNEENIYKFISELEDNPVIYTQYK